MKLYKLYEQVLTESLISENSLYGKKIIDGVTKKIGDSSDDTLNKIAIAGLYRNVFGNIQQVKSKEQLDKVFDDWYNTTIEKMVKTSAFIDNKDLATKYLDAYVKNIKTLGDKARRFSFKKIESGLVDLVNNNGWIKNSIKQANDIYNPKDDDIVYQDENIIILDTNTKAKCVMYGRGESWCITKPFLNYYNTYRNYGATPYFVLQKNVKGNEHKLVIMHYKNGYAIADRSNTGDRAGDSRSAKPWSYVEQQIPNLKGLEKYFPYREITEDENRYEEILVRMKDYKGDNLQGYIEDEIRGLVINGSQVTDVDFIRDYAPLVQIIRNNQLKSLRPEVLNSLIESGYFLTRGSEQTNILNPKQQLRVARIKIQNKISLKGDELLLLPEKERNDYISNLNSSDIEILLEHSRDPEKIIDVLGNKWKDFISNLNSRNMGSLLTFSKEPEKIIDALLNNRDFISNLDSFNMGYLLSASKERERAINVLLSNKDFISNLDSLGIEILLKFSKEPEKVINILGDKGKEYISNLNSRNMRSLLKSSKNEEKLKQILRKYGHDV